MSNNNSLRRPFRPQGREKNTPCSLLPTSPLHFQVRQVISNKATRELGQCEASLTRINKRLYDGAYVACFVWGFRLIWRVWCPQFLICQVILQPHVGRHLIFYINTLRPNWLSSFLKYIFSKYRSLELTIRFFYALKW